MTVELLYRKGTLAKFSPANVPRDDAVDYTQKPPEGMPRKMKYELSIEKRFHENLNGGIGKIDCQRGRRTMHILSVSMYVDALKWL
jgi:hypothetical protein